MLLIRSRIFVLFDCRQAVLYILNDVFFFFQAEDGIRDLTVTGVQTCALPISIKNVTFNEPYFMGHFPGRPVMPGVLILEALAQAAGLLAFDAMGQVPDENNI